MKTKHLIAWLLAAGLGCGSAAAQGNPNSLTVYAPQLISTTSFTTPAMPLGSSPVIPGLGASNASCFVEVIGTSLTTATFGVTASYDPSGALYVPVASLASVATPGTTATTATATANGVYQFKCGGMFSVKFVTSGTFTATSISLQLVASPNAQISSAAGASSNCQNTNNYVCTNAANTFTLSQIIASVTGPQVTFINPNSSTYSPIYAYWQPSSFGQNDHAFCTGLGCSTGDVNHWAICITTGTCPFSVGNSSFPGVYIYGSPGVTGNNVGAATSFLSGNLVSADPGCTTTAQIGRVWYDNTTNTTVDKVCLNVAGTLTWVTK